jgi:hypothetical protein
VHGASSRIGGRSGFVEPMGHMTQRHPSVAGQFNLLKAEEQLQTRHFLFRES